MGYVLKTDLAHRSNYGSWRDISYLNWIVIHYTANDGDTDENNGNYFNGANRNASAHFFVDDDSVTQSVPLEYSAWHCGGGLQGSGGHTYHKICTNSNSIGIEICDDVKNGVIYPSAKTIENVIALTKDLMKRFNIPASHVIRHYDVTGKICPAYWCGTTEKDNKWKTEFWNKLTAKNYLSKGDNGTDVKVMQTMLIETGFSCGKAGADGDFGNDTDKALREFQKAYKLTVDGKYGEQSKATLISVYSRKVAQSSGDPVNNAGIYYTAHCQTYGWMEEVHDGQTSGTVGYGKRLEALKIDCKIKGVKIKAQAHLQSKGWVDYGYINADTIIGTVGQAKRIEAIELEAEGLPNGKALQYRTHLQGVGWTPWINGGFTSGTVGIAKRIEAIQIKIV